MLEGLAEFCKGPDVRGPEVFCEPRSAVANENAR